MRLPALLIFFLLAFVGVALAANPFVLPNGVSVGSGSQNVLTILPGASSSANTTLGNSGTGAIQFNGLLSTSASGIQANGPITVTPTGSSSTRKIQDYMADVANVVDFGADPTGTADSTTAINAAVATGKCAYLPHGTYLITNAITGITFSSCIFGDGMHASILHVTSAFSPSAPGVLEIANSGSPPVPGAMIHDLQIDFDQPSTQTARANFAALGSCTTGSGGTGCKYPPAVYDIIAAGGRVVIQNVTVAGAWDGFYFGATGNVLNTVFWLTNIEMGAIDIGLSADGGQDVSHIKGWHSWPFGFGGTTEPDVYNDGHTVAWSIGREDGLQAMDVFTETGNLVFTSDFGNSEGPSYISGGSLDGLNILLPTGNLIISDAIIGSPGSPASAIVQVTGGELVLDNDWIAAQTVSLPFATVSSGSLLVNGGVVENPSTGPDNTVYSQTGGNLIIKGQAFYNAGTVTTAVISSTGGGTVLLNNFFHASTGPAISITTDNSENDVDGNAFNGMTYSYPTGSSLQGLYNGTRSPFQFERALVAAGTNQSTALALFGSENYFMTVGAQTGAILPSAGPAAQLLSVYNQTTTPLLIYPPSSGTISPGGATNAPVSIPAESAMQFQKGSGLDWYLKQPMAGVVNVLNYGADPTNHIDSTAAFQAALATNLSVYVPSGQYLISNQLTLSSVVGPQCMYGDGPHSSFLHFNQNMNASASSEILLNTLASGSYNGLGACVHDIGMQFDQPFDAVTTTSSTASSGASTIVVASASSMTVNNYIEDQTVSSAIPAQTKITNITGNTLTLSNPLAANVGSGDTIHAGPSRANFAAMGSCTSTAHGTGCKYAPAIYTTGGRSWIWNVSIVGGAWVGINMGTAASWAENIECGCLSVGYEIDGSADFSHLWGWHNWNFNINASASYGIFETYTDGTNVAQSIGRVDGLNAGDLTNFQASLNLTANHANSEVGSEFTNVMLDGVNADLIVAGGNTQLPDLIQGMYKTGDSTNSTCSINMTAGYLVLANPYIVVDPGPLAATPAFACISGSAQLKMTGGHILANASVTAFLQTGGVMDIEGVYLATPASVALSVPTVESTGADTTIVKDNVSNNGNGGTGTILSVADDEPGNVIYGNNFGNFSYSIPTALNVKGTYDISSHPGPNIINAPADNGSYVSLGVGPGTLAGQPAGTLMYNAAFGYRALNGTMTTAAIGNAGFGSQAGENVTSGASNACFGGNACLNLTTGSGDTMLGAAAGQDTITSSFETFMGEAAGINVTGSSNTIMGANVGRTTLTTGTGNILIGTSSAVDTPAATTSNRLNIGNTIVENMTVPTISSGFGTSPSVTGSSTAAFLVNVGTGGIASAGIISMGTTATTGWACSAVDKTNPTAFETISLPTSATTITLSNFNRATGAATAWTASDVVLVGPCVAY